MSKDDALFEFSEEKTSVQADSQTIKILTVEDDIHYQQALLNSLHSISIEGDYTLKLLSANSVSEAALELSRHPDIALTFIDVVMEDDDSGLRLVSTIREVIGNADMRIVLLTGQPGFAPEESVMKSLDIDEYWNKSDVSAEKLQSIVASNLRTWRYISQVSAAKQGLQLVLDASRSINSKHDMQSFSSAVLHEISNILGITQGGGILCTNRFCGDEQLPVILTTNGCFNGFEGQAVSENLLLKAMFDDLQTSIKSKKHVFNESHSIFFFDTASLDNTNYITIVKSDNPINEQNRYLLKVFSENVSTGFSNMALLNKLTELAYTETSLNLHNRNWLIREIRNMNLHEQYQTQLIVFEVQQFEEKSFTFGHDFCQKILQLVHQSIHRAFSKYLPRIALINNRSFAMLISNDCKIPDDTYTYLSRQTCEIENVKQFVDIRVLSLKLSSVLNIPPEKIISLAESSLNDTHNNQIKFIEHTATQTHAITRRYEIMAKLRTAIGGGKLQIALQPKLNLQTKKTIGFEALARWKLTNGRFISPDEFIEIAETSGLICELGSVILDKVLTVIKCLQRNGVNLPVAYNASSYELMEPSYFEKVANKIKQENIPPNLLEIEVTETQEVCNYTLIKASLEKFMALGIKVSIDDFGTGYSSLAHITELPANTIKIDKFFVIDLQNNINNQFIIEMVITLAKRFNLQVIAEGIENEFEYNWLKNKGCTVGQGYYFAKPLFIEDLIVWLKQHINENN